METPSGETVQQQEQVVVEKTILKVVVAIDESEESFYALKWALEKLFNYSAGGAPGQPDQELGMVTVVHVQPPIQPFIYPVGPVVYATVPPMVESLRKAQEQNANAILSRALQMCREKMIKAETLVLQGDSKEMICQAVEQMHVDLLVVGSRGLGQIKRAFLGSVSDYCAHHAKCPILIVKPPKESHK